MCRAHPELMELAGKLKAPVVHALRGKEFIEYDNPCDVGMTGLLGTSSGYHAMMSCEVLLMIGTDFPYREFYPNDATIVQIDLRGEQLGRRTRIDCGLEGDTQTTLRVLLPKLDDHKSEEHLKRYVRQFQKARQDIDELAVEKDSDKHIHQQYVAKMLDELAADDAILPCDVGTPTIWAARYLSMNGKRRLLGSFIHGSKANALPQAIGAQVSHPGRQVIVFKNAALAIVELEMKAAGILEFATDLHNPDLAKMAEAAGFLGLTAETPDQVRPMLIRVLRHGGAALVEVIVHRQELLLPPKISLKEMAGFGLFMVKALLSGHGDEIIDLVKINLF